MREPERWATPEFEVNVNRRRPVRLVVELNRFAWRGCFVEWSGLA